MLHFGLERDFQSCIFFVVICTNWKKCMWIFAGMREDVQTIFLKSPRDKQVLMFSATLNQDTRNICRRFMNDVNILGWFLPPFDNFVIQTGLWFGQNLVMKIPDMYYSPFVSFKETLHRERYTCIYFSFEKSSMTFYFEMNCLFWNDIDTSDFYASSEALWWHDIGEGALWQCGGFSFETRYFI